MNLTTVKAFFTNNLGHVLGLVITVATVIGFHSWLAEHDARMVADGQVKTAEATVAGLRANQTTTATVAAAQVQTLRTQAVKTTTPAAALVILRTTAPELEATTVPTTGLLSSEVAVDAVPLYQDLNAAAQDKVNLAACTTELTDEKGVTTAKDAEIKALKSKGGFWVRVRNTAVEVGIGAALGYAAHR